MIDSTVITYADPKTSDTISEMEFNSMLQHSYEQALAGEERQIEDVFTDLERFFNNRLFKRFNIYGKEKASNSFICSRLPSLNHLFTSH